MIASDTSPRWQYTTKHTMKVNKTMLVPLFVIYKGGQGSSYSSQVYREVEEHNTEGVSRIYVNLKERRRAARLVHGSSDFTFFGSLK